MKKSLCIVSHGPELRYLEVLKKERNCIINVATTNNLNKVINKFEYPEVTDWYVLPEINKSKKNIKGERIISMVDAVYRKMSLKKGINSFSYTRKKDLYSKKNSIFFNFLIYYGLKFYLYYFIRSIKSILKYLYKNNDLISFYNLVDADELIVLEHLGSKDIYTFNASLLSKYKIIYYLNNHKDISVRPYIPFVADEFNLWYNSQKELLFKYFKSRNIIKVIGISRVKFWKDQQENKIVKDKRVFTILYTCSDPIRRPYEIHSLTSLCIELQDLKAHFILNIRLNPMDKSDIYNQLQKFDFVKIINANWHWDKINFINFPTKKSEKEYFQLLYNSDIVVSLPSTTIVEGEIFNKKTICLLDSNSSDKKEEQIEMNLVLPFEIIKSEKFSKVNNIYDIKSQIKESLLIRRL